MRTFNVKIVETLVKDIIINAETESEAKQKVIDEYYSSNIILTADDFYDVDFITTKLEN